MESGGDKRGEIKGEGVKKEGRREVEGEGGKEEGRGRRVEGVKGERERGNIISCNMTTCARHVSLCGATVQWLPWKPHRQQGGNSQLANQPVSLFPQFNVLLSNTCRMICYVSSYYSCQNYLHRTRNYIYFKSLVQ